MILALVSAALAQTASVAEPRPLAGHPVLDVRLGVLRSDATPHPFVCAEVAPLDRFSVEGCGTGAGFLFPADGPDLAHFRARARVVRARAGRLEAGGYVGAGLAEAERAADAPGFVFASTSGAVETAGPEATLSVKARAWVHPRAYVTLDATAGAAWMAGAPEVLGTPGPAVGFAAITAGAGF